MSDVARVPVKSPFLSKINWAQVLAAFLGILTLLAEGLPPEQKAQVLAGILFVSNVATIIFKTFYTGTVTQQSLGPPPSAGG